MVDDLAYPGPVLVRLVGRRERMGRQHGRWRDVLLLERRSPLVG